MDIFRRVLLTDVSPGLEWGLSVVLGRDVIIEASIPFIVWFAVVAVAAASMPYHLWRWQKPEYRTARNLRVFIASIVWLFACLAVVVRANPQFGLLVVPAGVGVWIYTSARIIGQRRSPMARISGASGHEGTAPTRNTD